MEFTLHMWVTYTCIAIVISSGACSKDFFWLVKRVFIIKREIDVHAPANNFPLRQHESSTCTSKIFSHHMPVYALCFLTRGCFLGPRVHCWCSEFISTCSVCEEMDELVCYSLSAAQSAGNRHLSASWHSKNLPHPRQETAQILIQLMDCIQFVNFLNFIAKNAMKL